MLHFLHCFETVFTFGNTLGMKKNYTDRYNIFFSGSSCFFYAYNYRKGVTSVTLIY